MDGQRNKFWLTSRAEVEERSAHNHFSLDPIVLQFNDLCRVNHAIIYRCFDPLRKTGLSYPDACLPAMLHAMLPIAPGAGGERNARQGDGNDLCNTIFHTRRKS